MTNITTQGNTTATAPKIELRRVHFSERLIDETNAFDADVWVNGKKAGHAGNDGHGGCTIVHLESWARFIVAGWVGTLPKKKYEAREGMEAFEIEQTIDSVIDELLEAHLAVKERAKVEKRVRTEALKIRARGFVPVLVATRRTYIVTCSKTNAEFELVETARRIVEKHRDMRGAIAAFVPHPDQIDPAFSSALAVVFEGSAS